MCLVSSFTKLVQSLAGVMTRPTFENFLTMTCGWIFCRRRTVTQMILGADAVDGTHHFSTFHRLFAAARWSRDALGLLVFRLIEPWTDGTIYLSGDDTLAHKRGIKMFGTTMHYDPQLSSRKKKVTTWGHNWVVLSVVVRFPLWPQRPFSLPILFRLYLGKSRAHKERRVYYTRPQLLVQMLNILCKHRKTRRFHVLVDSAYGGESVLAHLPENCELTSRAGLKARLVDAPPTPAGPKRPVGRPRRRGKRLPSPVEMLASRARHIMLDIYGRHHQARVCDAVGRFYAVPEREVRVVATEALRGGRGQEAFFSTDTGQTPEEILTNYSWRWSAEVTIHDSKQYLGFEDPQGWTRQAVERTAPMAMLLYSLIVLWFVETGHRSYRAFVAPWYRFQEHPSFRDMLATLRRASVREMFSAWGLSGQGSKKAQQTLENAVTLAI